MKYITTAGILALLLITRCSSPEIEIELNPRIQYLMDDLRESEIYSDLIQSNIALNLDKVQLGEFHQFELLAIPIIMGKENSKQMGRVSYNQSQIVLKFSKIDGWSHFLRVSLRGNSDEADLTDFTGLVFMEDYLEEVVLEIKYIKGRFESYQVKGGSPDGSARVHTGLRSMGLPGCEGPCHVLDCVGRKFEEKSWFSKITCAASLFMCLAADAADCIHEGCANSNYKECGDE